VASSQDNHPAVLTPRIISAFLCKFFLPGFALIFALISIPPGRDKIWREAHSFCTPNPDLAFGHLFACGIFCFQADSSALRTTIAIGITDNKRNRHLQIPLPVESRKGFGFATKPSLYLHYTILIKLFNNFPRISFLHKKLLSRPWRDRP
jgi:hypothetical protein